jgi:cytosine deaminase
LESVKIDAAERAAFARAVEQAKLGLPEGGIPIGAALTVGGRLVAEGRNRRVQEGDPIAHGEMDCIRRAGRRSFRGATLFTTLSPCMMCAGTIVQFGVARVIVGENVNFGGNEQFLAERGVEVVILNDPDCIRMMGDFISQRPDDWMEDVGES